MDIGSDSDAWDFGGAKKCMMDKKSEQSALTLIDVSNNYQGKMPTLLLFKYRKKWEEINGQTELPLYRLSKAISA